MFTFTSPNYEPFVWPFSIGMSALLVYITIKYIKWIYEFDKANRVKILKGLFSLGTLRSVKEIFLESLVHRKIYRENPMLGYMHMCFGLGWALLIIVGHLESSIYQASWANTPYYSIFFYYFLPAGADYWGHEVFGFLMDLILLMILSGLFIAWGKRWYSRIVGMKKTTKQRPYDRLVKGVLWSIFPLRFLAESMQSAITGHGSFLTHSAGEFFASFLPVETLSYPLWWAYSLSLGIFFLLIPGSRYMHIPTEMVYIFLKNWGVKLDVKLGPNGELKGLSKFEIYSCSRCGICLNQCQLLSSLNNQSTQPVYFLRKVREDVERGNDINNCLMCGRCEEMCPVDIDLNALRMMQRQDHSVVTDETYSYIKTNDEYSGSAKVAYFAGCMGHLTPGVIASMRKIFNKAGVEYHFVDEGGGVCCGRPLRLSGNRAAADVLMQKNSDRIVATGAEILVTSCPICYKSFKEEYELPIKVMHHTEYINMLMDCGALNIRKGKERLVFHNPCELGRGCNVVEAPLRVLDGAGEIVATEFDGRASLCCGGSLANTVISPIERGRIAADALSRYTCSDPDCVVTACPLCKKNFAKVNQPVPIRDIAEVVAERC